MNGLHSVIIAYASVMKTDNKEAEPEIKPVQMGKLGAQVPVITVLLR